MKKVLTKFLAISSVALLMLSSCKKSDTLVTTDGGKPGTLTASTTTLVLDRTKLTDTSAAIRFSFTAPQYTFSAAVTNTLQIDAAGDNWKNPTSVTLGNKVLTQGYSTTAFNALLLKMNLPAGTASAVNVRIQHALSPTEMVYSNVVALTVTPFNLISFVYVTGAFSGWVNPGAAEDSLVSPTGNGVYTGIINFNATGSGANQFLVLPVKGSWTHKYATNDSSTPSSTITYDAPNNFNAPAANGQYLITFNLNTNTISFEKVDYYSLIGNDFTGQNWDTDNWMKYVNDGNGNWVLTIPMIAPSGGGFKIRQDGAWSNSWGLSSTPGVLTDASGGNITISAAGTYTVTFNMAPSAFGSPAVTLAPYTITP